MSGALGTAAERVERTEMLDVDAGAVERVDQERREALARLVGKPLQPLELCLVPFSCASCLLFELAPHRLRLADDRLRLALGALA